MGNIARNEGDANHLVTVAHLVRLEDEIARRGARLCGGKERSGPCPVCGGHDRFSVNIQKQVWNCRGCQRGGDVIALVQHLDGCSFAEAIRALTGRPPEHHGRYRNAGAPVRPPTQSTGTHALAMALWANARDPRGSLVESYLESRRLELPDEAAGESIRYHQNCPFQGDRYPAMVCLVRDIRTNEPRGIHRTALTPDGAAVKRDGKTFRMSLGAMAGGAIKLDDDADVTMGICIGEGVETTLAGRQIGYLPVWAVLSTAGIAGFPILPGIDGLTIFGECDGMVQSEKAIKACAERWLVAGREVLTVWPLAGKDLNDEIMVAP